MWHRALQAIGALWVLQSAPQLPAPRGYVNDFAGVIPAADASRIQRIVDDVRAKSGGEIVIVTLSDLGGRDPGDVALQLGRQWKVGAKGAPGDRARNTGVIILVVPKETSRDGRGHVFIATGTGAEGFITDGDAGQIRDEAIPQLRARDYGGAITLMTTRVAQRFATEFNFSLDSSLAIPEPIPMPPVSLPRVPVGLLLFLGIWILVILIRASANRRSGCGCGPLLLASVLSGGGRGGWSSGGGFSGGGGGFGGFGGGGGFSGGGAGGSW